MSSYRKELRQACAEARCPQGRSASAQARQSDSLQGQDSFCALIAEHRKRLHAIGGLGLGLQLAELEAVLMEEAIRELHARALDAVAEADRVEEAGGLPIAIAAAGSFARRELMPHSDIDIVVIAPEGGETCDQTVKLMYHGIFDSLSGRLGLDIGYSCRSADDLGELDQETRTCLAETRLICGSRAAYDDFVEALNEMIDPAAFLLALQSERTEQRLDYAPAIQRVEPDLKHGPGSLRDLLSGLWQARAAFGLRSATLLQELGDRAILSCGECNELRGALVQILDERRAAHIISERKTDMLYTSLHEPVAHLLGYFDTPELSAIDRLMRDHYAAAERLHRYGMALARRANQMAVPVTESFAIRERELHRSECTSFAESPHLAVIAVEVADKYGVPLSYDLESECRAVVDEITTAHDGDPCAEALKRILSGEGHPGVSIRLLADTGLLGAMIPEIRECAHRIPSDPTHEYTIIEHTLQVVDSLAELRDTSDTTLGTLARTYAAISLSARRALLLTGLMHDAGKVIQGEKHAAIGRELTIEVGRRLGLPEKEVERAARLVEVHLVMARMSRLRDLHDSATIKEFLEVVTDAETLDQLYLLTYADTKSVGLGVFSDIEARLLEDLYAKTLGALSGGMQPTDLAEAKAIIIERATRELRFRDISEERVRAHCEEMPAAYVVGLPLGVIGSHIAMVRDLQRDSVPVVEFYNDPEVSFTELTLCCFDDPTPGLFAKMCGTLLANGIDIHSANILTRTGAEAIAIDTLLVSANGARIPDDLCERTARDTIEVLTGAAAVRELLERRRRHPEPATEVTVEASNTLAEARTVIRVRAHDSRGLLYRITRAIATSRLNLHSAQITTWGANAEDSFYVSLTSDGGPVPEQDLHSLTETLRRVILEQEDPH